jgi:hypothetical protein
MSGPIIAYKGFDKDMKCQGFQFAEGETYHEDKAELCKNGFHACTMPLDVLGYYPPGDGSIYRMVELDDVCDEKSNDSKICAKTIKIGAEIGIPGLVKAQIELVKNTIGFDEKIKKAKESPDKYATGYRGAASATGEASVAMASGRDGRVMGAIGCAIFAVERGEWDGNTYQIVSVAAGIVDGVTIKEKTWYKCVGGKFVEV